MEGDASPLVTFFVSLNLFTSLVGIAAFFVGVIHVMYWSEHSRITALASSILASLFAIWSMGCELIYLCVDVLVSK